MLAVGAGWQLLSFCTLLLLSLSLCWSDIDSRTLPNQRVALLFLICIWINYQSGIGLGVILSVGSILVGGLILFALGVVGAGDIKLLAAFSVAINPALLPSTLVLIAAIGGAQALFMLCLKWIRPYRSGTDGVPYGIPIALASLLAVGLSILD